MMDFGDKGVLAVPVVMMNFGDGGVLVRIPFHPDTFFFWAFYESCSSFFTANSARSQNITQNVQYDTRAKRHAFYSWFSLDVTKLYNSKPEGLQNFYLHSRKDYLKICLFIIS